MKKIDYIRYCEADDCCRNLIKHQVRYRKQFNLILCSKHYYQMKIHGQFVKKEVAYCLVKGCDRKSTINKMKRIQEINITVLNTFTENY